MKEPELIFDKLKFKLTEEKPCEVTFSVQIPIEIVKTKKEKVAQEFQKVARLQGFRAGKAPLDLVQKNYADKIQSEALEQLLKDSIPYILKQKSLSPISTPMVDKIELNGEETLSFDLIVERNPDFSVKNYKKIPVTKKIKKITDEDAQKELKHLQEKNSKLVPSKSEHAEKHHYAVIQHEGFFNGRPLPELKADNQLINLSAPQSIEGFAEGILGLKLGESKEITVQFPQEYPNKELAGHPVQFKLTLQDLKEKSMPALDDEFAKDFELASLEELKQKIRESLEKTLEKNNATEEEKQILDHLVKENPIPVPESMVHLQVESLLNRTKKILVQQGLAQPTEEKEKELKEKYRPDAERHVRISYLLSGVGKEESLNPTQEELAAELKKAVEANPGKSDQVEHYFKEHESMILNQILEDKVIKFLIENAKIKEVAE